MGFARNHKAKVLGAVLASALAVTGAVLAFTSPDAGAATPGVRSLCDADVPVGQVRCFAEQLTGVHKMTVAPNDTPDGYGPSDLSDAYKLDTTKGAGQVVAIVDAYDDPNAEHDLAMYRSQYGLPACTTANGCFRKVNQNGSFSPLPSANASWAGEISLDLDMVSAVCPKCRIILLEASSTYTSDLGTAVNTAVRMGAKFVSNSYGGPEGYGENEADVYFNHPGVAITVSTGDDGYAAAYPASSPYVTAVGGTSLVRSSTTRGWTDTVWAGAGSGCSGYETRPTFQTMTACGHRAVADVSAVANPKTGVAVYDSYGTLYPWGVYGGTSASSPIIAGVYALAGKPGASDYPNSYPYNWTNHLNDVVAGSNGRCANAIWCTAATGWDGPTGLGTPNTAAAFTQLGSTDGAAHEFNLIGKVTGSQLAGLPIGIRATPVLPAGDALATPITWKSARGDCTFAASAGTTNSITCPAALLGATSVTATARDTAGKTRTIAIGLTFGSVTYKRPVRMSLTLLGQSGTAQTMCSGLPSTVRAGLVDANSGLPIKGVGVAFSRQSGNAAATSAGSASSVGGVALVSAVSRTAVRFAARSVATGPFAAGASGTLPVNVIQCTPHLTGSLNKTTSFYGDSVTVSGQVTRASASGQVPLPSPAIVLTERVAGGKVISLGSLRANSAGAFSGIVRPTMSGQIIATVPTTSAYKTTVAALGNLTVKIPPTTITGEADQLNINSPITVSGTLIRNGASPSPLAGRTVTVRVTADGKVTVIGSAVVAANSRYQVTVHATTGGELSVAYAGAAGSPAATADIGALQTVSSN